MDFCRIFQAISDNQRHKILMRLQEKECCVSELVEMSHISQSSISKHLSVLRNAGLVKDERRVQQVFYSLECENIRMFCREYFLRFDCCNGLFAVKEDKPAV
jgi:ArsR family transcriptional regulator